MAHNLNIVNGVVSMAYNEQGGRPWHKLGTPVNGSMTSLEALNKGGLNYRVEKLPLFTRYQDSALIEVPHNFSIVRTDTMQSLGVVGDRYYPLQNADAFTFFDSIVGSNEAIYETVGALGLGEKIWIMAKLPNDILVNGSDRCEAFLLLYNSHDGTSTIKCRFTPVRVVCQNTLNVAMAGAEQEISIRHTESAEAKLSQAHKLLDVVKRQFVSVESTFQKMALKAMTVETVNDYLAKVYPVNQNAENQKRRDNIIDTVKQLYVHGKGNGGNTLWDIYNGVTEFIDHHRSIKNAEEGANHWESATFGSGALVKERAYIEASELVAETVSA